MPTRRHQETRHGRANDPGPVDDGTVQRYRVHQVFVAGHFHHERLPGGHVEGHRHAAQRRQHEDFPYLDMSASHQRRKDKGRQHHPGLGVEDDGALGMPVGHGAAPEGEQQHGKRPDGGHGAQQNLGAGQLIHQPALGGALHPGPDERHELADEEQPEIAMLQRGEGVAPGHAAHDPAPGLPGGLLRNTGDLRGWFRWFRGHRRCGWDTTRSQRLNLGCVGRNNQETRSSSPDINVRTSRRSLTCWIWTTTSASGARRGFHQCHSLWPP